MRKEAAVDNANTKLDADDRQPFRPGDRETDEFWQDAWNFDTEGLQELLRLADEVSVTQCQYHGPGGEGAIYRFRIEGRCASGGGRFGLMTALMRTAERLRPFMRSDDVG
jgi:hypothetical protein